MSLHYLPKMNLYITHCPKIPPFKFYLIEMQVYELKETYVDVHSGVI